MVSMISRQVNCTKILRKPYTQLTWRNITIANYSQFIAIIWINETIQYYSSLATVVFRDVTSSISRYINSLIGEYIILVRAMPESCCALPNLRALPSGQFFNPRALSHVHGCRNPAHLRQLIYPWHTIAEGTFSLRRGACDGAYLPRDISRTRSFADLRDEATYDDNELRWLCTMATYISRRWCNTK